MRYFIVRKKEAYSAQNRGNGVYFFSEYVRDVLGENVTQDAAADACNQSHRNDEKRLMHMIDCCVCAYCGKYAESYCI